jgi:DNA-binding response OmpR family regulator
MRLAAQLLALVWYRHNHIPLVDGGADEAMMALRTAIREKAGRLATLDVVESYLRLITERGGALAEGVNRQVLLVGGDRISRALAPGLSRVACQTVFTEELADAQTLAERRAPGAIVLDHNEFPHQVEQFSRMVKLDGSALLFVLTDSTDPALMLNLLDIGVDDVFGPPHHFDLIAARIDRAIRSRAGERTSERATPGQFSATFGLFSFLDLIQALGQGRKSVRVELTRNDEEEAVIFLRKGQMVHATCGELTGAEAVYRVIAWEDEGEFVVRTETDFPERQIEESNESILMEGCRLLDESRR